MEPNNQQNNQPTNNESSIPQMSNTSPSSFQPIGAPTDNPQQNMNTNINTPPQPSSNNPLTQNTDPYLTMSQNNKSNFKLIIVIASLIIGIIILIGLLYVFLFSASAMSKKTSNAFMDSMSSGNIEKALTMTSSNDEDTKNFLENASTKLRGAHKLTESGSRDQTHYFLYEIDGAENKYARTEVSKLDNRWKVDGLVYDTQPLRLIPGKSNTPDTGKPEEPKQQSTQSSSSCLVQSDFDDWYMNMYGMTATSQGMHYERPANRFSDNIHFPADSLEYKDHDNGPGISNIVALVKDPKIKNKQYKIELYGSVGTSQADKDFANKRAEKVKSDLVSQGVPADRIYITDPSSASDYNSSPDAIDKSMARVVVVYFDPTCDGNNNSGR